MSLALDELRNYLEGAFPDHVMSEEWDRARNVLVFRLERTVRGKRETLLAEVEDARAGSANGDRVEGRFDAHNLAALLREHYRVLVTSKGSTPLPWKQLSPNVSSVDEASWESFPASDPASFSSLSRAGSAKPRTR